MVIIYMYQYIYVINIRFILIIIYFKNEKIFFINKIKYLNYDEFLYLLYYFKKILFIII